MGTIFTFSATTNNSLFGEEDEEDYWRNYDGKVVPKVKKTVFKTPNKVLKKYGIKTFYKKPLVKWKVNDTLEFVNCLPYLKSSKDMKKRVSLIVKQQNVDGNILSKFTKYKKSSFKKMFKDIKRDDDNHGVDLVEVLWVIIQKFNANKYENVNEIWIRVFLKHIIRAKNLQIASKSEGQKLSYKHFELQADKIYDMNIFYTYFFKPFVVFSNADKRYKEIASKQFNINEKEKYLKEVKLLRNKIKNLIDDYDTYFHDEVNQFKDVHYYLLLAAPQQIIPEKYKLSEEEKLEYTRNIHFERLTKRQKFLYEKLKIKLIITEILTTKKQKLGRKFISRILSMFQKNGLGLFHSAITIGPWYLEWNNGCLVAPKRFKSSNALFVMDIDWLLVDVSYDIETVARKLCEICYEWNSLREYDNVDANCQQFVEHVIYQLTEKSFKDLTSTRSHIFKSFFDRLRIKGSCEIIFKPCVEFLEENALPTNWNKTGKKFDTHTELDFFVHTLKSNFRNDYRDEYNFLKAIDRMFWLKLQALFYQHEFIDTDEEMKEFDEGLKVVSPQMKNNMKFLGILRTEPENVKCFFRNPFGTGSFTNEGWLN